LLNLTDALFAIATSAFALPFASSTNPEMTTTVKVFCGNLPFTMSQDELKNSFAAHGKVV
jgi:hypothetical protein